MSTFSIYFSEKKDKDLYGLLNDIGLSNFRKCTIYCLFALSNDSYIVKAKEFAKKSVSDTEKKIIYHSKKAKDGSSIVHVKFSFEGKKNLPIKQVLDEIETGYSSLFIKNTIRQVLGPNILLKYILKNDSSIKITDIMFQSLINIGQTVEIKTKQKTRRNSNIRRVKKEKTITNVNNTIEIPSISNITTPSFNTLNTNSNVVDSPSFDAPSFSISENIEEDNTNSNNEFDVLSMLEAML